MKKIYIEYRLPTEQETYWEMDVEEIHKIIIEPVSERTTRDEK